jgi:hypothetical protein
MLKFLKKAIIFLFAFIVMLLPVGLFAKFALSYPLNLSAVVLKIFIYYPKLIPLISMVYLDNFLILNYINLSLLLMIILAFIYIARSKNFNKVEKITLYILNLLLLPVIMVETLGYRNLTFFWITEWFLSSSIIISLNYYFIHNAVRRINNYRKNNRS